MPNPNTDSTPPDPFSPCLAQLIPALEILQGFQRRHKNQHRPARWWAEFNILRRLVRKLVDGLHVAIQEVERPIRRRGRNKKLGLGTWTGGVIEDHDSSAHDVVYMAGHMRNQVIPRAYVAFNQLSADKQHAPLGLLLLGIIAQVDIAMATLLASPSLRLAVTSEGLAITERSSLTKREKMEVAWPPPPVSATEADDVTAAVGMEMGAPVARTPALEDLRPLDAGRGKGCADDDGPMGGSAVSGVSARDLSRRKHKKEKRAMKRKQSGDEFDRIFDLIA